MPAWGVPAASGATRTFPRRSRMRTWLPILGSRGSYRAPLMQRRSDCSGSGTARRNWTRTPACPLRSGACSAASATTPGTTYATTRARGWVRRRPFHRGPAEARGQCDLHRSDRCGGGEPGELSAERTPSDCASRHPEAAVLPEAVRRGLLPACDSTHAVPRSGDRCALRSGPPRWVTGNRPLRAHAPTLSW